MATENVAIDAPEQWISTHVNSAVIKYSIAACNATECGYEKLREAPYLVGLERVDTVTQHWLDEYQVELSFSYPEHIFNHNDGTGKPDYFKIVPEYLQPGKNEPRVHFLRHDLGGGQRLGRQANREQGRG